MLGVPPLAIFDDRIGSKSMKGQFRASINWNLVLRVFCYYLSRAESPVILPVWLDRIGENFV